MLKLFTNRKVDTSKTAPVMELNDHELAAITGGGGWGGHGHGYGRGYYRYHHKHRHHKYWRKYCCW
ncbi:MAG: bacteriocin [Ktedonobacteraceae bacterium]|nr:bacteriocin [Ktedonobacteraceae bacterium]